MRLFQGKLHISYPLSEDQKWTIPNYIYFRHVVTKALSAENITAGPVDGFGEKPEKINIKKEGVKVQVEFTVNGATTTATVLNPNIKAKNGIIHSVDTILLSPEPTIETPGDLIEVATKLGNFTRILKAIADLGLTEKFKAIEEATIFAPTDDLFEKLEKEKPGFFENLTNETKLALISR